MDDKNFHLLSWKEIFRKYWKQIIWKLFLVFLVFFCFVAMLFCATGLPLLFGK